MKLRGDIHEKKNMFYATTNVMFIMSLFYE